MKTLIKHVVWFLGVWLVACGSKSPAAPSTTPPPPAAPTALTFTFEPDVVTNLNRQFARLTIETTAELAGADMFSVAVRVNIGDAVGSGGQRGLTGIEGEVWWDAALLTFDTWSRAPFLSQGGIPVDWQVASAVPGRFVFSANRPTGSTGILGEADVFYLRLKPVAGVRSGVARLVWNNPAVLWNFQSRNLNAYGGTVTIR